MAIVLQVLGWLFIITLLLILGGILFLRRKLKQFGQTLEGIAAEPLPARITLTLQPDQAWDHAPVKEQADHFFGLGYVKGSAYRPNEMPNLEIFPLVHQEVETYGVVYSLNEGGKVWSDVVQRYENGTSITVSNSQHVQGLKSMPGHPKVYLPGLHISDLHRRLLAERPEHPAEPVSHEAFKSVMEESYAREMDWRDTAGVSAEEIAAIARNGNHEVGADQLKMVEMAVARQANSRLRDRLYQEYLNRTKLSAAEWQAVESRLVFIHDRLTPEELAAIASDAYELEDDEEDPEITFPQGPPRQTFAAYNESLPAHRQFRLIDQATSPIEADVYVEPES